MVAVVIIVIIVGIGSVATYEYIRTQGDQTTTVCNTCFINEPVVDVIIPSLVSSPQASGSTNSQLNVTKGANVSLTVQVFPSRSVSVAMSFKVLSAPANATSFIFGTMTPNELSVQNGAQGNSTLQLQIPGNAAVGVYDIAVSATDVQNSTWVWGTEFIVNVN